MMKHNKKDPRGNRFYLVAYLQGCTIEEGTANCYNNALIMATRMRREGVKRVIGPIVVWDFPDSIRIIDTEVGGKAPGTIRDV